MTLKEQLINVQEWSQGNKVRYFEFIADNVPIGVRMIMLRDEINDQQKIEALRLISEFQREIHQIRDRFKGSNNELFQVKELFNFFVMYSKMENQLLTNEIAFCLQDAYERIAGFDK